MMKENGKREKMYTAAEVAEICGVSIDTARRWYQSGALACYRLGGRVRISESQLQKFLDARKREQ